MSTFFRLVRWRGLAAAVAYCHATVAEQDNNNVEQPIIVGLNQNAEHFTHKYLLQQTSILSVNSSSQMITIALVALSEASLKYKNELLKIMDVLENNEWSDEELDNVLMESRYDITNAKTYYLDSISAMDSALRLGQSTAQMSFTVEANTVFNCMAEKLYASEKEFQSCIEEIRKVEDEFTKLLADTVKKSKK